MTPGETIIKIISFFGGIAGLIAFGWKIFEEKRTYLRIKVESKKEGENYSVLTEIENINKIKSKVIDNAFLLITRSQDNLISCGQQVADKLNIAHKIEDTSDFEYFYAEEDIYISNHIAFIPLSFYYSENIDIADERLTYRCYIDKTKLEKGAYSVRFYIYGEKRLHRSTQDLMIIA